VALCAIALVIGVAPGASAGSENGAGPTFQMTCDGALVTLTVGGGPWSAAHIEETGAVFVPVATHLYLRDPESGATVYEEHDYKGAARPASSSCVEDFTSQGLLGSFIVEADMRP
jgi:hypothetical protein